MNSKKYIKSKENIEYINTSMDTTNSSSSQILGNIVSLNQQRKSLEQQNKFVKAGKITQKLQELEEVFKTVYLREVEEKLRKQREQLDIEYKEEFNNMCRIWEQKLELNEREIKDIIDQIHQKQSEEKEIFKQQIRDEIFAEKKSPEVLNLDFKIQKLAKNLQYNEASVLQKQRDKLMNETVKRQQDRFQKKLKNLEKKFTKNHQQELTNYEQKLNFERQNIMKIKEQNFEQLESKYKVIKEKMDNTLKQHFNKEKKKIQSFRAIGCFDLTQSLSSFKELNQCFVLNFDFIIYMKRQYHYIDQKYSSYQKEKRNKFQKFPQKNDKEISVETKTSKKSNDNYEYVPKSEIIQSQRKNSQIKIGSLSKKLDFDVAQNSVQFSKPDIREQCSDYFFHGFCFDGRECSKLHLDSQNKYQKIQKELFQSIQEEQSLNDLFDSMKIIKSNFQLGQGFMHVQKKHKEIF